MKEVEAEALSDFLLPMLQWCPEKRATAAHMINHPWLTMKSPTYDHKMNENEYKQMTLKNRFEENLNENAQADMNELQVSESEINNADVEDNSDDDLESDFDEDHRDKLPKRGGLNSSYRQSGVQPELLHYDRGANPQFAQLLQVSNP